MFHQEELHGPLGAGDDLYPEELAEQLAKQRSLEKEKALLSAVRNRSFQPSDGKIRFRGTIIPRSKLKATLAEVDAELRACNEALDAHDRRCRSHHERLAASFSPAWAEYHRGLLHLLHYAEHNLRNLGDANRKLHNTYAVVTADKNVSGSELQRLLKDAAAVHAALSDIYRYRTTLKLDWHIASRMPSSWSEQLEEFGLAVPIRANISN
jgi:hypothetical protein